MALGVVKKWEIFLKINKKLKAPLKPVAISNHVICGPP
jgi:hypothetical protein